MLKKFLATVMTGLLLACGTAHAYDLPKLKPDKPVESKKPPILKSDWKNAELFEQTIKARLARGDTLKPDDPARCPTDKNYVFVAFYHGAPYFLDKYSIKVRRNADAQIWEQNIFPITQKFSPRNATATHQKFCLIDGDAFNSTKAKDALETIEDDADRNFLRECFKVGYYFAFGEEARLN